MTSGQQRALRELERLSAIAPNTFELVDKPYLKAGWLISKVCLNLGPMEMKEDGLDLREREEFILRVPPGFPFDRPGLRVEHTRFAMFPHVIWTKTICLYQSSVEWNPSDGLYGFFDRLKIWLGKAAINDMDPIEGPLEPPHHDTDFTQNPFVIRADAPCAVGKEWIGLAILEKYQNRTELIAWNDLSGEWPQQGQLAFSVILPERMPMEFPTNGGDLFRAIEKAGMDRKRIITNLGLAALFTPEGEPIHLILGLPMRRAVDGSQRLHIDVWTTDANCAGLLRKLLPGEIDPKEILTCKKEFSDKLMAIFERGKIKWCQVLEDRNEIVVRRDIGTPVVWFAGKKILILGCGALGSWIAEIIGRTKPSLIHLVDNSIVKPGVLARQNFELGDIGSNKSDALARRLKAITAITHDCTIVPHAREAYAFVTEKKETLQDYDVVLDCTASAIFQMKLERDWGEFSGHTPPFISLIIDAQARHCLCVLSPKDSSGGIWDAYLSLKIWLCIEGGHPALTTAFYSEQAVEKMFQPEPGCSEPTFIGSTADVMALASGALNIAAGSIQAKNSAVGIALSAPGGTGHSGPSNLLELPQFFDTVVGNYRVRVAKNVFTQARAWVRQNNRVRSLHHETGGLLWGVWDDAVQVIWIFDLSGPPPDSQHNPAHFLCGVEGTIEEHRQRLARTHGSCGFVGHWHTHPNFPSYQSDMDMKNMATLVSSIGQNKKRSVMLIFGRMNSLTTAGVYIYESQSLVGINELISVGTSQIILEEPVV